MCSSPSATSGYHARHHRRHGDTTTNMRHQLKHQHGILNTALNKDSKDRKEDFMKDDLLVSVVEI